MEALSGSCLLIPCSFRAKSEEEFNGARETSGVWIKNDSRFGKHSSNVIFNSTEKVNKYPMRITGNLTEKNCTTSFSRLLTSYTDKYFFRVENKPFMATASCDPVRITVRDSPASPRIEISGDLKEDQPVTISCSAFTPCPHSPPKLTWNLQQDSLNTIEENTDGTFTTKIQKSITLSDRHDGYNITCSAAYPVDEGRNVKTAEERETLSVSYAPKDTSVTVSKSGSWVNLTCSSRAKPPVSSFTWFKKSNDGAMNVSEGWFYSLNATDGGVYYCMATNELGRQQSSEIDLTAEGVKQPSSSSPWGAAVGGIVGVIVLIFVVVAVWRLKSKHLTSQQTQSLTAEEPTVQERDGATEKEDIHYGEIDFSKQRSEASPSTVQDSGQQQDTLYAQVKVSKPANSSAQTADNSDCIYAQVKIK
ncbi:sialic acid-binding Ig-like lectin 12 isoform X2 [Chaetodon trifascialis]|uniref:sialic acid-binding Ig-like lectin 12 isoform X2 n=1 Tax=Chaetodon trifascialis TaxID=109706 RepID=UPI0039918993